MRGRSQIGEAADRVDCTPWVDDACTVSHSLSATRDRLLIDPRCSGEKISSVAYGCGFGDLSYFNRVFRRHYGAAPSDVRAQAGQPDGTIRTLPR